MLKDDVIKLVFKDTEPFLLSHLLEELWIICHLELRCIRIETNTSGGYGRGRSLLYATG
jgi:hypothetical protein